MDTVEVCGHQKEVGRWGKGIYGNGSADQEWNVLGVLYLYQLRTASLGDPSGAAAAARGRHMGNSLTRRLLQR